MNELLPGLVCGLAEPGQGHRVAGRWTLNSALKDIILTCGYSWNIGNKPMEVGGGEEGGEEEEDV